MYMVLSVVNNSGIDVDLYVGAERHRIYANMQPQEIEVVAQPDSLSVRKVVPSLPPNYSQMLWSELLGGVARLFSIEHTYNVDVSPIYRLSSVPSKRVELTVTLEHREPLTEIAYDVLKLASPLLDLTDVHYVAENKQTVLSVYKKCRSTAHAWVFALAEVLFILAGMCILCPILLALYSATGMLLFKLLMVSIPFVIGGFIALVVILPLCCFYKYEDKQFYKYMEHEGISSFLQQ